MASGWHPSGREHTLVPFRGKWLRRKPSLGVLLYTAYQDAKREANRGRRRTPSQPADMNFVAQTFFAGALSLVPGFGLKLLLQRFDPWPIIGYSLLLGATLVIGSIMSSAKGLTRKSASAFSIGLVISEIALSLFVAEAMTVLDIPLLGPIIAMIVLSLVGLIQVGLFSLVPDVWRFWKQTLNQSSAP